MANTLYTTYNGNNAYKAGQYAKYINTVYICIEDAAKGQNPANFPFKWTQAFASSSGSGFVPTGAIMPYGNNGITHLPSGYVLCNGASLSRTTYAALFAVIGTSFGSADASHFNVPDLRNRFPKGNGSGTIGDTGGSATHTPTGTISAQTWTQGVTGVSAVSAGTPTGTISGGVFVGDSVTTSATSAGTPAGSVSAPTFTGNSVTTSATSAGTPSGTVSAPTLTMDSYTPAGTNANESAHTHSVTSNVTVDTHNGAAVASGAGGIGFQNAASRQHTVNNPAVTSGSGSAHTHTFTGTAATLTGTNSAPTFTGSALSTHTHTVTATGTNSAPTFTGSALGTHTHTVTATGTISGETFTGNALGTHVHTISMAGTVSLATFTGVNANTEPEYLVIGWIIKT